MKRWKVWDGYEYILLNPSEFKKRERAIRYFDRDGNLVGIQILRRTGELGQLSFASADN